MQATTLAGVPCDVIVPATPRASDRVVLYLHGGGFFAHLPRSYRRFARRLAQDFGATVYLPAYRLAPEHRYPAASDDCLAVYRQLLDGGRDPASVCLMGDSAGGNLALVTLLRARDEKLLMQEELFDPILPVLACDSMDEAIAYVTARPRPLALYYFGTDAGETQRLVREVHAGGMTINDWAWHVFQCDLPFGGSGNSGIGSWRGPEGFRALSHAKAVFDIQRFFPAHLFHPPYGTRIQRLISKIFLGDADPALASHAQLQPVQLDQPTQVPAFK